MSVGALALPVIASQADRRPAGAGAATSLQFYSPRFDASLVGLALANAVEAFEQIRPDLRLTALGEAVPIQAIFTLKRRAAARQLPDLIAYAYLPTLVQNGLALDVTENLDTGIASYWNDLSESVRNAAKVDNRSYGLPFEIGTSSALLYDRRQIEAAGLDSAAPPRRWDEFVVTAQRATHVPDRHGFALLAQIGLPATYSHWLAWFTTAGGSQFAPDQRRLAFGDGSASLAALSLYANLSVGVKVTLPNSTELGTGTAGAALASGQVAMIQGGGPELAQLRFEYPTIGERIGLAPLPWKERDVAYLQPETIVVGSQTSHRDPAWDFARYLVSTENLVRLFQTAGVIPASASGRAAARRGADPFQRFFLDRIEAPSTFVPNDTRFPAIAQRGSLMVHDVICGCVTPAMALQMALDDLNKLPI